MKKIRFKSKYIAFIIFILLLNIIVGSPVQAQGIGLTGNFYQQHYEMTPGETSSNNSVYVIVSNSSDEDFRVKMNTESPEGVSFFLSDDDFVLCSGENQKINIGLEVDQQATPGEYKVAVSADIYREGTGIKVTSYAQQQASLSILGESGYLIINTVTEEKQPLSTVISIFRDTEGELTEIRSSRETEMKARLTPGNYVIQAQLQGINVATQDISLANDEEKEITLVCYTLCVADFSVTPVYTDDAKISSSKVTYSIANLEKQVDDFKAVLKVILNGNPLDEMELMSTSILDVGSRNGSYNYIPSQGWQENNTYGFQVELYSGDQIRYQSSINELVLGQPESISQEDENQPSTGIPMIWIIVGGSVLGVILIVILIIFIRRRIYYY